MTFTVNFWKTAGETAVRVAAAAALGAIGTSQISALEVDWGQLAGIAVLAGIVSILTSLSIPTPEVRTARREEKLQAERKAAALAKKAEEEKKAAKAPAKPTVAKKRPTKR
jgi:hypothetical protein